MTTKARSPKASATKPRRDVYAEVTESVLAQLKTGTAPWVKPWHANPIINGFGALPYSLSSRRPYRGVNVWLLEAARVDNGWTSNAWVTFKQAKARGGHVRKGEHGTMVVLWKPIKRTERDDSTGEERTRTFPLLRAFTVFNSQQCDDLAMPEAEPVTYTPTERHARAQELLDKSGATIHYGGDRACYSPTFDTIRLPDPDAFATTEGLYSTALHELTHWTGHESRLARKLGNAYGSGKYAEEELVAELGAAFLCASAGVAGKLQHAEYVASWIQVLSNDPKAYVVAASRAQKAADYVLDRAGWTESAESELAEQETE